MLLMIEDTLDKDSSPVRIVLFGLKALALMVVSIAIYYGITQLVFLVTGAEFNSYVTDNVNGERQSPAPGAHGLRLVPLRI